MNTTKEKNLIYQFRKKYGLTQKLMSKVIKKSLRHVQNLEYGKYKITDDVLFRLKHTTQNDIDIIVKEEKYND